VQRGHGSNGCLVAGRGNRRVGLDAYVIRMFLAGGGKGTQTFGVVPDGPCHVFIIAWPSDGRSR